MYDVYQGTHMQGVKPGAVKYLRVVESPEKRFWTHPAWDGQGVHCPGMNWHDFENKRILGTVPVEDDGSRLLRGAVRQVRLLPAPRRERHDDPVHAQRHDGADRRTQRLRRLPRRTASPRRRAARPRRRWPCGAQPASSPAGTARRACSASWPRCSRSSTATASSATTSPRARASRRPTAARSWFSPATRTPRSTSPTRKSGRKRQVKVVGAGPAEIQQAYSWGSHASKLVEVVRKGHYDVKLSKEDFDRLVTWVDINAPYYPSYATNFPDNPYGRSPLTNAQTDQLKKLGISDMAVSFDRPEMSPGLAKFQDKMDPKYKEALAIIQAGKEAARAVAARGYAGLCALRHRPEARRKVPPARGSRVEEPGGHPRGQEGLRRRRCESSGN